MHLSKKAAFVRNAIAAGTNGAITLIILLIAPLGIVAVVVNTLDISENYQSSLVGSVKGVATSKCKSR
jgi:hypothetical protein